MAACCRPIPQRLQKPAARMSADILRERRSGVVLHPTSLPGPHGSGDLGAQALYFVDWLHTAGQTLWQTLPLGPVGPGHSPYMGTSAMAGNPMLVALEPLMDKGWLSLDAPAPSFDALHIDFPQVMRWRMERLREAYQGLDRKSTRLNSSHSSVSRMPSSA